SFRTSKTGASAVASTVSPSPFPFCSGGSREAGSLAMALSEAIVDAGIGSAIRSISRRPAGAGSPAEDFFFAVEHPPRGTLIAARRRNKDFIGIRLRHL